MEDDISNATRGRDGQPEHIAMEQPPQRSHHGSTSHQSFPSSSSSRHQSSSPPQPTSKTPSLLRNWLDELPSTPTPPIPSRRGSWSPTGRTSTAVASLKRANSARGVAANPSLAKSRQGLYQRGESESDSGSPVSEEEEEEAPSESSESESELERRVRRSGRDRSRGHQRDLELGTGRARSSSRTGMLRE
jgi:hypothetical protein